MARFYITTAQSTRLLLCWTRMASSILWSVVSPTQIGVPTGEYIDLPPRSKESVAGTPPIRGCVLGDGTVFGTEGKPTTMGVAALCRSVRWQTDRRHARSCAWLIPANDGSWIPRSGGKPITIQWAEGNELKFYGGASLTDSITGGNGADTVYGDAGHNEHRPASGKRQRHRFTAAMATITAYA